MNHVSIELKKHEWKFGSTRNAVGTRAVPQLFPNLPKFHSCFYLTIRLQARVFYEQIVNEAQPSWLSLVDNEGE